MSYSNVTDQDVSQLGRPFVRSSSSSVSGTSAEFIALIIVSATLPTVIRDLVSVLHPSCLQRQGTQFSINLLVDFLIAVFPVELIVTVLNIHAQYICLAMCTIIFLLVLQALVQKSTRSAIKTAEFWSIPMKNGSPAITYFRAFTNIFTAFSILAVDFKKLFPSYFCKSRIYGTTLMDTGLGFFVLANAVLSPEARGIESQERFLKHLATTIKETSPLLVLGVLRYSVNSLVHYSVSYHEYGVHWNFFFTLAALKLGSSLMFRITPRRLWFFLGPAIILVYQYYLSQSQLKLLILFGSHGDSSRVGFVDANREGLASSVGHLAVYLIGVQLGRLIMRQRETVWEWCVVSVQLAAISLGSYLALQWAWTHVQMPSRRFANLAYLFFIIFVTTLQIARGLFIDILVTYLRHLKLEQGLIGDINQNEVSNHSCSLLYAVNYNGLLYFLLANILTGVVNITIPTRNVSQPVAFTILTIYMFILSFIFAYMYQHKISFKKYLVKILRLDR